MVIHAKFFEHEGQRISYREAQVLLAFSYGWTIAETAVQFHLSPKTIQRHRENLRHRFSLHAYHDLRCFATKWQPNFEEWVTMPIKMGKDAY